MVDARQLPAQYAGRDLYGVCAICRRSRYVRLCPRCHAVFCEECRGRYFWRGIEFVRDLLFRNGSHGAIFQE